MTENITSIQEVMERTDWGLLAKQKGALVRMIADEEQRARNMAPLGEHGPQKFHERNAERLGGLLHWIDAIQDGAAAEGFPAYPEKEE